MSQEQKPKRLPKAHYFSGGYVMFFIKGKTPHYIIFNQLLEDEPIHVAEGDYTGQDPKELAKPFVLEPPYIKFMEKYGIDKTNYKTVAQVEAYLSKQREGKQ